MGLSDLRFQWTSGHGKVLSKHTSVRNLVHITIVKGIVNSMDQGFSIVALLTFWVRYLFVVEIVLCALASMFIVSLASTH